MNEGKRYLLAGVTIITLGSLGVFVKFAIFVGTYWVEAQVIECGIHGRVTTPERPDSDQNKNRTNIEVVRHDDFEGVWLSL